ncbi:MAG TPA: response regulator [Pyrinomonadaceae bacterium]|nr:response regulator [Pyrinomonadaceae bacterium]
MLASASPRATESKYRILYLGVDLELIAAVRRVFTESDYRLVTCSDRESAVLFLKSEIQYDLMLIDFDWRGMEVLRLTRLARSLGHRKQMPIILVAGTRLSSERKTLARKAGVKECVTKTRDMGAVSDAIVRLSGIPGERAGRPRSQPIT